MRIGMTSGADDYITKPFRPGELREAVAAQLNRREVRAAAQAIAVESAVTMALDEQEHHLAQLFDKKLAAGFSDQWPSGSNANPQADETFASATVLFVDVLNYAALAEVLSDAELQGVVRKFYSNAGDAVHLFGARHMQFVGEALLAVFVSSGDSLSVNHGLRAARAAFGLVDAAKRVNLYLTTQFADWQLPPFEVGIALHSGGVTIARLQDPLHGEVIDLPVGDAVNATLQLQKQTAGLGWTVVASVPMLRGITGGVKTGRRALITLPGRTQPMDAAELQGIAV